MKVWHLLYLFDDENKTRGQVIPGIELSSDTVKRVLDVIQQRQDYKVSKIEGNQECTMRETPSSGWTAGHERARLMMREERKMESLKKEFSKIKNDLDAFHPWKDGDDYNLLFHATQEGSKEAVQALLTLGADPTKVNYWGFNVLHAMAKKGGEGQVKMARLCIEYLDEDRRARFVNSSTSAGLSPLMEAVTRGDAAFARLLVVECGADVNQATSRSYTPYPLLAAVDSGHAEVVEILVQHGANVNVANSHNDTPVGIAAYYGYYR